MAGFFFVTGMTVIQFPENIGWTDHAKPTYTGACVKLLPAMIDRFGPAPELYIFHDDLSPAECYWFMWGVPFDFIIGGGTRPAKIETVATCSFVFRSPEGEVRELNNCLWNEEVKPVDGGTPASARRLEAEGWEQISGPRFEYNKTIMQWEHVEDDAQGEEE